MTGTALVGYDGSDTARAALAYAARRVGPEGHIVVAHIVVPPSAFIDTRRYDSELGRRPRARRGLPARCRRHPPRRQGGPAREGGAAGADAGRARAGDRRGRDRGRLTGLWLWTGPARQRIPRAAARDRPAGGRCEPQSRRAADRGCARRAPRHARGGGRLRRLARCARRSRLRPRSAPWSRDRRVRIRRPFEPSRRALLRRGAHRQSTARARSCWTSFRATTGSAQTSSSTCSRARPPRPWRAPRARATRTR